MDARKCVAENCNNVIGVLAVNYDFMKKEQFYMASNMFGILVNSLKWFVNGSKWTQMDSLKFYDSMEHRAEVNKAFIQWDVQQTFMDENFGFDFQPNLSTK